RGGGAEGGGWVVRGGAGERAPPPKRGGGAAGGPPRPAGDGGGRSGGRGTRHAHDQTEIRDQAVVRPRHGGPECVPANGPVALFEAGERVALDARLADGGAEEAGVGALLDRGAGLFCFRPAVLPVAVPA